MKSKTGSLLTLIAAIIDLAVAGIVFLLAFIIPLLISLGITPEKDIPFAPIFLSLILALVAILVFLLGILLLTASRKMKSQKTVRNGAIWAIILGALTIGQVSGILALIGGIIGIIDADK